MEKQPNEAPQPDMSEIEAMIDRAISDDPVVRDVHLGLQTCSERLESEGRTDELERIVDEYNTRLGQYYSEIVTYEGSGYLITTQANGEVDCTRCGSCANALFGGVSFVNVAENGDERSILAYKGWGVDEATDTRYLMLMPVDAVLPEFRYKSVEYYEEQMSEIDPELLRSVHSDFGDLLEYEHRLQSVLDYSVRSYAEVSTEGYPANIADCMSRLVSAYVVGHDARYYMIHAEGEHDAYYDGVKLDGTVKPQLGAPIPAELVSVEFAEEGEVGEDGMVDIQPYIWVALRESSDSKPTHVRLDARNVSRVECFNRLAREASGLPYPRTEE